MTVKISLCIYVVLSWDELKVRQNLLDSDYEIYMVCLLVATVNRHKLLQFAKKSNIALLPCLFMILWAVSMIMLIMLYHILARFYFQFIYLLYLIISLAWQAWHRNSKMNQPPKHQEMGFFLFSWHLEKPGGVTAFRKLKCPDSSMIPLPAEVTEWFVTLSSQFSLYSLFLFFHSENIKRWYI